MQRRFRQPVGWCGICSLIQGTIAWRVEVLVMQHPVFQRFWYPTIALSVLNDGPRSCTLLGQQLVFWLGRDGAPRW